MRSVPVREVGDRVAAQGDRPVSRSARSVAAAAASLRGIGQPGETAQGAAGASLGADADVLGDGQAGEDRELLEGAGQAEPGAAVVGEAGDVASAEQDAAGVGAQRAGQAVEQRALTGAVRVRRAR